MPTMCGNVDMPASATIVSHEAAKAQIAGLAPFKASNGRGVPSRTFTDRLTIGSGADSMDAIAAGLWCAVVVAFEQSPARQPELGSHPARNDLGLVEPTPVPPARGCGCPRHDVEVGRPHTGCDQTVDEQPGEVVRELPTIAVLEAEQHVAGTTGEGQSRDHVAALGQRARPREREPARAAQHRPDPFTACAMTLEDHALVVREGCDSQSGSASVAGLMALLISPTTSASTISRATLMPFSIALSLEEPCEMMHTPSTPSSIAPPYVSASSAV
jgi:hypothetical protein